MAKFKHKWMPARKREHIVYQAGEIYRENQRFYQSARWKALRRIILNKNPLCVHCLANGVVKLANHVDHIKERKEYPELAYDVDNLQPLCVSCHSRKTAQR